jgi:hypothetical protein
MRVNAAGRKLSRIGGAHPLISAARTSSSTRTTVSRSRVDSVSLSASGPRLRGVHRRHWRPGGREDADAFVLKDAGVALGAEAALDAVV